MSDLKTVSYVLAVEDIDVVEGQRINPEGKIISASEALRNIIRGWKGVFTSLPEGASIQAVASIPDHGAYHDTPVTVTSEGGNLKITKRPVKKAVLMVHNLDGSEKVNPDCPCEGN
jgi:hypothetical protein